LIEANLTIAAFDEYPTFENKLHQGENNNYSFLFQITCQQELNT